MQSFKLNILHRTTTKRKQLVQ